MTVAPAEARWTALGTTVHVLVDEPARLEAARRAVADVLDLVDRTYSRFRPDSELQLAHERPGRWVHASPLLGRAIEAALRGARLSDGAVDPTVGRAVRAIGYDRDFASVIRAPAPITVRLEPVPGWQAIRFDPIGRFVRLPRGVELDLGSTGKALAADLAAAAAREAMGGGGVLVNLGGDIATAGRPPRAGWRTLVSDDARTRPDADGEVVAIHSGALATSSTTVRRWTRGRVELHHIVDPVTGLPARGPWRTVSVAAASCVDANVAATASIVLGPDALAWLEAHRLPSRLVSHDGHVVRTAGWPLPATLESVGIAS